MRESRFSIKRFVKLGKMLDLIIVIADSSKADLKGKYSELVHDAREV